MRPIRVSLEGFSAYRSRVDVDLADVEFFALSGPTGSGKSSLVDAMIFALYGRVPRLGGRAVAPVITAGSDRARVAFEFEVDGECFVASRLAERTASGASVSEARLETSEGASLASGAGEVTRKVEDLLRLRFEDFTKTVVLPQGEFARFLNAGSKERRDLLRDLLGLEIYARVRELANVRKSVAADRVVSARSQLDSLEGPEKGALEHARSRLESLEALSDALDEHVGRLEKAESDLRAAEERAEELDDAGERLQGINPPEHLDEMDDRLIAAREAESLAHQALESKREEIEEIEERLRSLAGADTIESVRLAYRRLTDMDERIATLDVDEARRAVQSWARRVEEAEDELSAADQAARQARVTHAAHTVGSTLAVGEPCPVCRRQVEALPEISPPVELSAVEERVSAANATMSSAREGLQSAEVALKEIETRRSEMESQREDLWATLESEPTPAQLDETENLQQELTGLIEKSRSEAEDLESALKRARREHEDSAESARSIGRALMVARERIADLEPRHSESDDPTVQWKDLLAWRDERLDELSVEKDSLGKELDRQRSAVLTLRAELVDRLEAGGVPVEKPYAVQVAREVEVARHRVSQIEETIQRSEALGRQLEQSSREEAVAGALAGHLKANAFERWLMAGAITGLVGGANYLLSQLSAGGYSLESDEDGSFRIIDHRNADEVRDVATLSGGETFLVSLALSLSLAETLSATGGSGLDAIILDEGFGALDEESLDIVASVLEELAGRGLMVGVITHVKELAARAPVRYQVTREPEGSKVEVVS